MDKETTPEKGEEVVLEKSKNENEDPDFDNAMAELEDMAKSIQPDDMEEVPEVEEPEEEFSKSLADEVGEDGDDDIRKVVNAEPLFKALVTSLDTVLTNVQVEQGEMLKLIKSLTEKLSSLESYFDKSVKVQLESGKMLKSMSDVVQGIGNAPTPLKSKLRTAERFETPVEEMTKAQANFVLDALIKANEIHPNQVTAIERTLNHGGEYPDWFKQRAKTLTVK